MDHIDRISNLPDSILCHILSFLPTKRSATTSVLSKRWKTLWRSVPALRFYYDEVRRYSRPLMQERYSRFVESVNAVIHSHQPFQTLSLKFHSYLCEDPNKVRKWVDVALRHRIEHLYLQLLGRINFSFAIPSSRTLVVLNLGGLALKPPSPVDFPSLKVLHLSTVDFLDRGILAELLAGCPVLEDLRLKELGFDNSLAAAEFKRLPKLVRAAIHRPYVPLEAVNNVDFLQIHTIVGEMHMVNDEDKRPCFKDLIPVFPNLTHVKLTYFDSIEDWLEVVEVLKHCPKLQILYIRQMCVCQGTGEFEEDDDDDGGGEEEEEEEEDEEEEEEEEEDGEDWPHVPEFTSVHLRTCSLYHYTGSKDEFRFVRYILRNAKFLQSMAIWCGSTISRRAKIKMSQKLFLCAPGALQLVSFLLNDNEI